MKKRTPIAVVGMACLFPGAPDLNTFWQNIVNKVDTTVEVPSDRWIVEPDFMYHSDPMPDKAFSKRSCLIRDFKFDPKGIDLDEELLKELDPLHQMVLSTGREALASSVMFRLSRGCNRYVILGHGVRQILLQCSNRSDEADGSFCGMRVVIKFLNSAHCDSGGYRSGTNRDEIPWARRCTYRRSAPRSAAGCFPAP